MSKEIRIGATEPASGAPAFAVSRDIAGILIGVRDKAAPQFAVSRDAEGLLIGGWPAKPPNPSSYVASGYVLGINAVVDDVTPAIFHISAMYYNAIGQELWSTYTQITASLTEWQRFFNTSPVDPAAAYVSLRIHSPRGGGEGACFTAMQLEGGTTPSAYVIGGRNLLLNPEFATGVDHWWANPHVPYPLSAFYSHEPSLPSSPPPGVTTGLKFMPTGWEGGVYYPAIHDFITLPTP